MRKIIFIVLAALILVVSGGAISYSMGSSSGASESSTISLPSDASASIDITMGHGMASSRVLMSGTGAFAFDQTFTSVSGREKVRLVSKTENSASYSHSHIVESRGLNNIRASQTFDVVGGIKTEAWQEAFSTGGATRVGAKVLAGDLHYTGFGEASNGQAVAGQVANVPALQQVGVYADAVNWQGKLSQTNVLKSGRPLTVVETAFANSTMRKISITY